MDNEQRDKILNAENPYLAMFGETHRGAGRPAGQPAIGFTKLPDWESFPDRNEAKRFLLKVNSKTMTIMKHLYPDEFRKIQTAQMAADLKERSELRDKVETEPGEKVLIRKRKRVQ